MKFVCSQEWELRLLGLDTLAGYCSQWWNQFFWKIFFWRA